MYGALSAGTAPREEPSPALSRSLSCPKLAFVLERALAQNPAADPTLNLQPDTAALRETFELAVLGIQAKFRVSNGCGSVSRESSSWDTGGPATSIDRNDTHSRSPSMRAQGHGRTCEQSGSILESFCWKATATTLHVTLRNSMPAEAEPFLLLASPAAGVPVSPAGAAPPIHQSGSWRSSGAMRRYALALKETYLPLELSRRPCASAWAPLTRA